MREFSDKELRWQANKLANYVKRGGSAKQWFDSKDFTPEDKRIVRQFWYLSPEPVPEIQILGGL